MASTDIVIAGAGLMGLTSAYYLNQQGFSVRLIDAGPVAQQASWAGGGILWPLYAWHYPQAVQAMAQLGRQLYPDLCATLFDKTGIDTEYRQSGMLILDAGEQDAAREWCDANNEPLEQISGDLAQPGLSVSDEVSFLPNVAQVRNPRLCKALKAALMESGVIIHEAEPVQSLVSRAGKFQGMQTAKAFYAAQMGIVATGAWTSQLLPQLSFFPVKGQMLLLRATAGLLERILLKDGRYVIPRADGRILIGSTVEDSGFNTDVDADIAAKLKASFSELLPSLAGLSIEKHWAGLRPATQGGVPVVGEFPNTTGLYVNAGHHRNGVVAAPASAYLLAKIITDGTDDRDDDIILNSSDYHPGKYI